MANRVAHDAVNHVVGDLKSTHSNNLASIVLYGSAAAGDHSEERSDYNLLIVLKKITPEDLRLAQPPMREWQRLGHPLPVYFTVEELNDAADVFPIEFLQMEKARVVLFGNDPFENVEITEANLRHQTEYELRSKLIQLRRLYIPASVSAKKLSSLMSDSLTSFAALFRPVLALSGQDAPVTKLESVRAIVRLLGLDSASFEKILTLQNRDAPSMNDNEANELFGVYMDQIERVVEAVDKMDQKA